VRINEKEAVLADRQTIAEAPVKEKGAALADRPSKPPWKEVFT
jgi:hypothetical protein